MRVNGARDVEDVPLRPNSRLKAHFSWYFFDWLSGFLTHSLLSFSFLCISVLASLHRWSWSWSRRPCLCRNTTESLCSLWQEWRRRWEEVKTDASQGNKPLLWTLWSLMSSGEIHRADDKAAVNDELMMKCFGVECVVMIRLNLFTSLFGLQSSAVWDYWYNGWFICSAAAQRFEYSRSFQHIHAKEASSWIKEVKKNIKLLSCVSVILSHCTSLSFIWCRIPIQEQRGEGERAVLYTQANSTERC